MDQYTAKIESKMLKMEGSLLDLTNEIATTIKFLFQLRENSTKIVKNLNGITSPENYLKEFMKVNCFILKYMNFLTEVNCKFEMLEMSETNFNISTSVDILKSEIGSENISKIDSSSHHGSFQNLTFIEDCEAVKKLQTEKSLDTQHNLNPQYNDKSNNANSVSSNDVNENFISQKLKNNSGIDSSKVDFSSEKMYSDDNVGQPQEILQNNSSNQSDCLKDTLSGSEFSSFSSSFSFNIKEKLMETSVKSGSASTLIDSSNTSPPSEELDETKSITGDNLETEDVFIKSHSSDVVKDSNFDQHLDNENFKATQLTSKENTTADIKPINIVRKLGKQYDVVIENIKSPSEFYVVLKNNESNLAELENKLTLIPKVKNKFPNKKHENRKVLFSKVFGKYVLYYSICDEMWYRAEIINWCWDFTDDFVTVFLLDYGESKCVSIEDLQCMPECLKEYPAFAQRCHLHGIFPLDMDWNSNTLLWEKGSTEKMRFLTENSDKIKIRIASDDSFHPVTSLPVTLWLAGEGDNQCVNQLLVERRYAVRRPDQQSSSNENKDSQDIKKIITETKIKDNNDNENLNNWNPMKEDFESYQNNYDLDINDPAAIIYGYVGKDYDRICRHFAKTGSCFKGRACKKEHQKLDPLGFTTDQEEIYNNAFKAFPIPPPKAVINVQITCLLTFNQFCCIPTESFCSGEENLQSLLSFMNKAENLREMKKLLIPPSAGQIVIARYSEDCSWYRARILESQPEKDLYTVLFVDYGNKETLSLSSIRAIEARYLHLPFQSIKCFIFGVDRNPKVPLKDIMDYLNERIYSGHITVEVVSKLPGEGTNLLVHVFDHSGRNIGNDLIDKEYAICKPEILIGNNSESIPG